MGRNHLPRIAWWKSPLEALQNRPNQMQLGEKWAKSRFYKNPSTQRHFRTCGTVAAPAASQVRGSLRFCDFFLFCCQLVRFCAWADGANTPHLRSFPWLPNPISTTPRPLLRLRTCGQNLAGAVAPDLSSLNSFSYSIFDPLTTWISPEAPGTSTNYINTSQNTLQTWSRP